LVDQECRLNDITPGAEKKIFRTSAALSPASAGRSMKAIFNFINNTVHHIKMTVKIKTLKYSE